ncbi:MAG: SOS response-associated peptidase [Acidobacteriota bacterium]|nr:SOS response-associated peptidase [Acidobacteriota bacterium]
MCGRFVQSSSARLLARLLGLDPPAHLAPRYNLAPTETAAVILWEETGPAFAHLRWGWPAGGERPRILHQARAETVARLPAFRQALARRRALVPADGFYEWSGRRGRRQPWWIHPPRPGTSLCFAAIWADRPGSGGSFALLTRPAAGPLRRLHHRMPLILPTSRLNAWINPRSDPQALVDRICREDPPPLEFYRVSPEVNRAGPDHPGLTAPIAPHHPSLFDAPPGG